MFNKLLWSDEFNYTGQPDPKKWTYELGASGWGNDELQYYTNNIKNAYVKDGMLNVVAINEPHPGTNTAKKRVDQKILSNMFTSARLVTKGKVTFKYGRFEIRAKLPITKGTWSAFWLYGRGESYSEIDIMENVGYESELVWFSAHSESGKADPNRHHTSSITIKDTSTEFHIYSMDWTPDYIIGYVDGVEYFSLYKNKIDPKYWHFDDGMFLIINLAVGGSWGGYEGVDKAGYPQSILVDYVRVYEYTPLPKDIVDNKTQ
jgi:beta-glucanase (GH16 family)